MRAFIAPVLLLIALGVANSSITLRDEWEEMLVETPNVARLYDHLAFYTARPHIAGTLEDYDTAEYTRLVLERLGFEAYIDEYEALLSYPLHRSLKIVYPFGQIFEASLTEEIIPQDPTSGDERNIATYLAYSASGNVTAELVYVNYGRLEDYEHLDSLGISVSGKIVIARYGNLFRGNKVLFAEQRGAVGILIYSDPADDGFVRGAVFPEGPWRPATSVQRGSATFLTTCPGDPGKPDRCGDLERKKPSIPVLPLSYQDAEPFLAGLTGQAVVAGWQGGLDITYRYGPGSVIARLEVEMDHRVLPYWNVMGLLRGSEEPDRRVIIGNHRDSWNAGSADPNSGTTAMLEVARAFSVLVENGYRPRRSIQLGSWDAEEFGLIGSIEFGETNADELSDEAVAYLNLDVACTGSSFSASSTPTLKNFIRSTSESIVDPNSGLPLSEVWGGNVGNLGSGSDFAVFVQHLGVASTDMGFGGPYGIYHSNYDSMFYTKEFSDPLFYYHRAAAQLLALMVKRLADADILPFDYEQVAEDLNGYLVMIKDMADDAGQQFDFSPIETAIVQFEGSVVVLMQEINNCSSGNCNEQQLRALNDKLMHTERQFMIPEGIPERPWYKSAMVAASYATGYGSSEFPAIADALILKKYDDVPEQIASTANAIKAAASFLSNPLP